MVLCAYAGAPRPRGYARGDQTLELELEPEPEPVVRQGTLNTETELVAMGARQTGGQKVVFSYFGGPD